MKWGRARTRVHLHEMHLHEVHCMYVYVFHLVILFICACSSQFLHVLFEFVHQQQTTFIFYWRARSRFLRSKSWPCMCRWLVIWRIMVYNILCASLWFLLFRTFKTRRSYVRVEWMIKLSDLFNWWHFALWRDWTRVMFGLCLWLWSWSLNRLSCSCFLRKLLEFKCIAALCTIVYM